MKPNGTLDVDVLVLGGGPAGAATALGLCRKGYSVALVDRSDYRSDRVGETLPPGIRPLLKELGLWEKFTAAGHLASGGVCSSWGGAGLYENDFIGNPHGVGWHIDRGQFDAMLAKEAELAGAVVLFQAEMGSGVETTSSGWKCDLFTKGRTRKVRTRFCVDATGRRSGFACSQGAKRIVGDRLIGVIGFLSGWSKEGSQDSYTLVESVADGWWYAAALPNGRAVAAYMTDADLFAGEAGRRSSFWLERLRQTKHARARLESPRHTSQLLVRCANSARLSQVVGPRWLAVGDAALSFDPLSSQGIYKALESGIRAAEAISLTWSENPCGLRDYAEWVQRQYRRYQEAYGKYYGSETRWPNSVFWRRRHLRARN